MFKVHDHVDFEIYTAIQATHNHDNHHCVLKKTKENVQVWCMII